MEIPEDFIELGRRLESLERHAIINDNWEIELERNKAKLPCRYIKGEYDGLLYREINSSGHFFKGIYECPENLSKYSRCMEAYKNLKKQKIYYCNEAFIMHYLREMYQTDI